MLKHYNRQIRKTNEVLFSIKSRMLENILKNENTLYDIQDMPVVTGTTKLQDITGIDNLVIVAYKDKDKHCDTVQLVDKEHGYAIESIGIFGGYVGLRHYIITDDDRGYIIKTNYKSMKELAGVLGMNTPKD